MRTFIALDLDSEIKRTISALVEKLSKGSKNIKWIRPEGMHITLKFLGEIKEEKIAEIEDILRKIARNSRPFLLKIQGTGYFPVEKKNPRVLWIGIEAEEILFSIQKQLEEELKKIGFSQERRKFHPHLTLGRVKMPSPIKETIRELERHQDAFFGEMIVNKITFFQSILKYTGAEYIILSEFQLR